jgi:hypothetical protein
MQSKRQKEKQRARWAEYILSGQIFGRVKKTGLNFCQED